MAINRHSPAVYSPQSSHGAQACVHGPRCLLPHAARLIGLRTLAFSFFALAKFARNMFTVTRWQSGPLLYTLRPLRRGEGHEPCSQQSQVGSEGETLRLQPARPLCLPQRVTDAL